MIPGGRDIYPVSSAGGFPYSVTLWMLEEEHLVCAVDLPSTAPRTRAPFSLCSVAVIHNGNCSFGWLLLPTPVSEHWG